LLICLLQAVPVAQSGLEDDLQLLLVSALAVGDLVAGAEVGLVHHLAGHDAALDGVADLLEGEAGGADASTGELGEEGRSVGVGVHGHVDLSFDNYCVTVVSSDATASGGRGAVLRSTGPPIGSTPCSRSPGRGCRPCLARRPDKLRTPAGRLSSARPGRRSRLRRSPRTGSR